MKKQVVLIHGGETFVTYEDYLTFLKSLDVNPEDLKYRSWRKRLAEQLGTDFDVISPEMPNEMNAKFAEWKVWFEKYIPFFQDNIILIGHSLGGVFLAKYLAENILPKKIKATFLLAAPYDDKGMPYSLADFDLPQSLEKLEQQGGKIFLYQSEDDPVVVFSDFEKYRKVLPKATARIFKDRQHFRQEEIPELIADIKSL